MVWGVTRRRTIPDIRRRLWRLTLLLLSICPRSWNTRRRIQVLLLLLLLLLLVVFVGLRCVDACRTAAWRCALRRRGCSRGH